MGDPLWGMITLEAVVAVPAFHRRVKLYAAKAFDSCFILTYTRQVFFEVIRSGRAYGSFGLYGKFLSKDER